MALTAAIDPSQSADCTQLVIDDTTVYGGAEPDRVDVTVDFVVTAKKTAGDVDITPSYDPATVTTLTVTNPDDGWINVVMTIKDAVTPFATLATLDQDIFLTCLLNECIEVKRLEWIKSDICGCEDPVLERDIKRIKNYKAAAEYNANILLNPANGQGLVERATDICG